MNKKVKTNVQNDEDEKKISNFLLFYALLYSLSLFFDH